MLASELIERLRELMEDHGDYQVMLDTNPVALVGIDYVDLDCEDDTIVISALALGETSGEG